MLLFVPLISHFPLQYRSPPKKNSHPQKNCRMYWLFTLEIRPPPPSVFFFRKENEHLPLQSLCAERHRRRRLGEWSHETGKTGESCYMMGKYAAPLKKKKVHFFEKGRGRMTVIPPVQRWRYVFWNGCWWFFWGILVGWLLKNTRKSNGIISPTFGLQIKNFQKKTTT